MKAFLILASAALAFATPAAAQELVTNGGFETGDLTGFTVAFNNVPSGVDSAAAASGNYGAYFGSSAFLGGIFQSVATAAGQSYLISFDLSNGSDSLDYSPNFYEVLFGNSLLFSATGVDAFPFTHFSTTAIATGVSTDLVFGFRNQFEFYELDNVSVTAVNGAVPEPTTWAMMLIGFSGMGVALRRRRKITTTPQLA